MVFGCAFQGCGTDVRASSAVRNMRCSYNVHFNTNPTNSAAKAAYYISLDSNFAIYEITACSFRNVKNLHVFETGSFYQRKRVLIFRDNDIDNVTTGVPTSNSLITMITNANRYMIHQNEAPTGGSDWKNGDLILNSDPVHGEPLGWVQIGTGVLSAERIQAQMHYRSSTVPPSMNAAYIGEEYFDSAAAKWYKAISVGLGSGDWVALN